MLFTKTVSHFLQKGEKRSIKIKRNILVSFAIRTASVAINFSIVPLTISYVNPVQYGIWLTLSSIVSWFSFFDFGMANGMRNRLATAVAFQDYVTAKKYISTTYAIFVLIASAVFLSFCFVNPYINWNKFLNVPPGIGADLHLVLLIVLGSFCVQFVVQPIATVLTALQEPAKAELITLLGQVGLLLTLVVLKYTVLGGLDVLVIALNVAPIVVMFVAGLFHYNKGLKLVAPSVKSVDFRYAKSILNVGGAFFLIQIGALVLYQTDNIIIAKILGPEAVTKYNVTYKLYSVIVMAFSIVMAPYWSAFTDAHAKNDFDWIRRSIKRLREVWLFVSFVVVPLVFSLAKFIFKAWLPASLEINAGLSLMMGLYVICYTCQALNCYFLNGVGKLKVQLLLYLFVIITNVPLGLLMGKRWGIEGVVAANIIAFVFMNIVLWVQTNKIVQHKASGIWNA